jgi:hypothetical protein
LFHAEFTGRREGEIKLWRRRRRRRRRSRGGTNVR